MKQKVQQNNKRKLYGKPKTRKIRKKDIPSKGGWGFVHHYKR